MKLTGGIDYDNDNYTEGNEETCKTVHKTLWTDEGTGR